MVWHRFAVRHCDSARRRPCDASTTNWPSRLTRFRQEPLCRTASRYRSGDRQPTSTRTHPPPRGPTGQTEGQRQNQPKFESPAPPFPSYFAEIDQTARGDKRVSAGGLVSRRSTNHEGKGYLRTPLGGAFAYFRCLGSQINLNRTVSGVSRSFRDYFGIILTFPVSHM